MRRNDRQKQNEVRERKHGRTRPVPITNGRQNRVGKRESDNVQPNTEKSWQEPNDHWMRHEGEEIREVRMLE